MAARLPVLAYIASPKLRREATTVRELMNCRRHTRSFLYEQMLDISDQRLLSRRTVWNFDPEKKFNQCFEGMYNNIERIY
jgi:hypothetical protein